MRVQWTTSLQEQEKKLFSKLKNGLPVEENSLQQKVRAKWIKVGDSNIKYFAAVLNKRTQRKCITTLTTLDGQILIVKEDGIEEVVKFYKRANGHYNIKSSSSQQCGYAESVYANPSAKIVIK